MITAKKLYDYRKKQLSMRGKVHPTWEELPEAIHIEWEQYVRYICKLLKRKQPGDGK
jgi:hypothetical protein